MRYVGLARVVPPTNTTFVNFSTNEPKLTNRREKLNEEAGYKRKGNWPKYTIIHINTIFVYIHSTYMHYIL